MLLRCLLVSAIVHLAAPSSLAKLYMRKNSRSDEEMSHSAPYTDVTNLTESMDEVISAKYLPTCRFFRDVTWTITTYPNNRMTQHIQCVCPKNSVAYILKHEGFKDEEGMGHRYYFACSPESRIRCQRKEPCRLFTVRKRNDSEEVNTNTLCQCPRGTRCPTNHVHPSVIAERAYFLDHINTFTGFCYTENE